MPCQQKQTQILKKNSNNELFYPEEHETAERNARGWHFDKVEASGDTGMKS